MKEYDPFIYRKIWNFNGEYLQTRIKFSIFVPNVASAFMKILINNANPIFGQFLSHRLLIDGNVVVRAENDQELIQKVEQDRYDLIVFISTRLCISDTCPLRILTKRGKVIVLSSIYDEKAVLEAYKMGISMYMTLPVDPARFIKKVRAL